MLDRRVRGRYGCSACAAGLSLAHLADTARAGQDGAAGSPPARTLVAEGTSAVGDGLPTPSPLGKAPDRTHVRGARIAEDAARKREGRRVTHLLLAGAVALGLFAAAPYHRGVVCKPRGRERVCKLVFGGPAEGRPFIGRTA